MTARGLCNLSIYICVSVDTVLCHCHSFHINKYKWMHLRQSGVNVFIRGRTQDFIQWNQLRTKMYDNKNFTSVVSAAVTV